MKIGKIGVVGCGQMGGGIVEVCARSGYPVTVSEVNSALLKKGLDNIEASLERGVKGQKLTAREKDEAMARIKGTVSAADFADRDLVIEAALEDLKLKKKIFAELDSICPSSALLATNTSCLSVADMAAATRRPDRVLGLHFFNPAPVMKLLELVRTDATSAETFAAARAFVQSLGKTIVVLQDSPGFLVNRLVIPQILNAIGMLEAGLATAEDIDTAMKLGLNYPMGPLALADLIGLDTVFLIANGIHDRLPEPQYAVPGLLKQMVAEGRLGRKTGKGFYNYEQPGRRLVKKE